MLKKHSILALVFSIICILSFIAMTNLDDDKVTIEDGTAITSDGISISYLVYVPKGEGPFPAVLIGHGFSASKEIMDGYARALAGSGFIVFSYDHRGHGHSGGSLDSSDDSLEEDVRSIYEIYMSDPRARHDGYGLVGYSMGGGAGYRFAEDDPDLLAMVGVAPALDQVGNYPQDLLIIIGGLDELFSPSSYRSLISERIGIKSDDIEYDSVYENNGRSTKIWVSPIHDHLTISYSSAAHEECVEWMIDTLGAGPVEVNTNARMACALTGLLSGMAAIISMIGLLPEQRKRRYLRPRPDQGILKDVFQSLIYLPLTALIVVPTIIFGLPLSTGYLLFLSLSAVPIWRALRRENDGIGSKELIKKLFSAPRQSYLFSIAAGLGTYIVMALFIGPRYLGIMPSMSRLPAVVVVFIYLVFIFCLDAWAYLDGRHLKLISNGARYALTRFLSIAIVIVLLSILSGNTFLLIALYVGIPLIGLYAIMMLSVFARTGSCGAAAVSSALFIAPMLVAVSPAIAIL